MNDEIPMEETEEMKEEINKEENTETVEEKEANLQESNQAEVITSEEEEVPAPAGEKPLFPLKKANRFFLAALFPLVFILVFGIILLIFGITDGNDEEVNATVASDELRAEDDYYEVKSDEIRGVFVSTAYNLDFPSKSGLDAKGLKAELDDIVLTCAQGGFNAIYFQVSPYSDALYNSEILPVSHVLTGREGSELPEGFDPLEYLLDQGHKVGIEVHAWINPVRVAAGGFTVDQLSGDNPAAVNPEYTVAYGGEVRYNLGIPEVRHLQARVCAELAQNYAIDGIIFDDYFYPQETGSETFDDSSAYKQHGGDYDSLGDFRRASSTALIRECYDAIKATRADCQFGVSPFGIWQNDDGSNGGSTTSGLESYESLYCDSLAFVKDGAVDYIAPQLYWQFDNEAAPYGELCDWWAEAVEGTDVKLMIAHSAWMAPKWGGADEFGEQIEYARTKRAYHGSLFFRYKHISLNEGGITDALASIYEDELVD